MILIFGTNGQVGTELLTLLKQQNQAVEALGLPEADFSDPHSLIPLLEQKMPHAVINAAAYTAVDQAEKESDLAFKINAKAPGVIARWCAGRNIPLVHYSTDYVFPGSGTRAWKEVDETGPLNVYGQSKLAGELEVGQAGGKFLIFRTSWVYAPSGKNFLRTMLKLGSERQELKIVNDQIGAPTLAYDLAAATLKALKIARGLSTFPSGIFHACNQGETSWKEFADAIFTESRAKGLPLQIQSVLGIPTSEYPTPAQRPLNSRMNTQKLFDTFGIRLPDWRESLQKCMEQIQ